MTRLPVPSPGLSSVTDFPGKSGISAGPVSQIGSALTQALGSKVPADVASAFASALMSAEDEAGRGGVEGRPKH